MKIVNRSVRNRLALAYAAVALGFASQSFALAPAYVTDITDGVADGIAGQVAIIAALVGALVVGIVWSIIKKRRA